MKKSARITDSIAPLFQTKLNNETTHLVLTSSSDQGVIRNYGRNGARYAPQAILNVVKKLNNHLPPSTIISEKEVTSIIAEKEDFDAAQKLSVKEILSQLKNFTGKKTLHLGGGHDHISPLLQAIDQMKYEKIIVLNVDAHCDTRVDKQSHSGTPFRDFSHIAKTDWSLYQYGIHEFANSKETMTPLANGNMHILFLDQLMTNKIEMKKFINDSVDEKTALILSLDVDALDASIFEGVSAVNHNGLDLNHIRLLMQNFFNLAPSAPKFFGIYEYNPIFDNLSQKGARGIAYLIHEFWKNC